MTMSTRQLTRTVSLDKPQILRPLPGPRGREDEWAQWGRALDRQRFYDPVLNWLDEHPIPLVALVVLVAIAVFVLAYLALT